jgi:hypothetical protein
MDYMVVDCAEMDRNELVKQLTKKVKKLIEEGWKPCGSVCILFCDNYMFKWRGFQAMTKE